ncbi:MAG: CsiV family protein, partial [Gammaproteobacteria bacterium]
MISVTAGMSSVAVAKSRWYQVEVIVFRHVGPANPDEEIWPDLESLPDFHDAVNLFVDLPNYSEGSESELANEVKIPEPLAFESLPSSALKMSGVFRQLRTLSSYTPLLHIGWRQADLNSLRARRVFISDKPRIENDVASMRLGDPIEERVEGTVQISVGRLLYVATDFVNYFGESAVRITEQRKVKLKE